MSGRASQGRTGNLPALLTPLIGRDADLAELGRLAMRHRLVTLTGVGGVGKTALAIAVASAIKEKAQEGAWFCDLSAVGDPSLVPMAIAGALDVKEQGNRAISDSVRDALRAAELVLVMDNCEQVLEAVATLLRELLGACPRLRLIATSREPLGLPGEVVWTVAPLALPDAVSRQLGTISRSPAVRLFTERAHQARPGFNLDAENGITVAAICERLDGIPLAIELCAARVRMMRPDEILDLLGNRLDIGSHAKTSPARQRTVRASIDWSYELLDDAERALFRRLSVFAGGFDLEAVGPVCGGGPVPDEPLSVLTGLVDKSLVAASPSLAGGGRYRLLETIRTYATERLIENRETVSIQEAHARHFLGVAETAAPQVFRGEQIAWIRHMSAQHGNFTAALEWSRIAEPEMLTRLVAALRNFWWVRGQFTEGRRWLAAALEVDRDIGRRSRTLRMDGLMAWRQGDYIVARRRFEESLAIEQQINDQAGVAGALEGLGFFMAETEDVRSAAPLFEQALVMARRSGAQSIIGDTLQDIASVALQLGRLTEARAHSTESLEIFKRLNDLNGIGYASQLLALVLIQQGDLKGATEASEEAVRAHAQLGDMAGLAGGLNSAAELAAAQRRLDRAMVLDGAAEARLRSVGSHRPSAYKASRERWLGAAQRKLGGRARILAAKGARLDDAQVVSFVLSNADDVAGIADGEAHEALSKRELEVAELLALGLTNRQISSRLSLSERTIDAHAEHIRNKLGVRSRAQIAAWVMRRGRDQK